MPVGQLNDRYWFLKNLRRHRERLTHMKAETDSSAPKLPVDPRNDKRKVGVALQRVQKINNDNARLLVRLSKVFANGGNLTPADLGKDPKLEHQRKALRNNASKMIKKRAELNRITFDNKFLLNRILDVPSVINYKDESYLHTNRRHKQLREETTYYRQKHSPFPIGSASGSGRRAGSSRASSASASGRSTPISSPLYTAQARLSSATPRDLGGTGENTIGDSADGETAKMTGVPMAGLRPPSECLAEVKEEHLAMLLSMRRPPELVKRVFSALMIMVSPFDPTHVDISWVAVQEWVKEIGTVKSFLDNLSAFDVSMVPSANPERTAAFMRQSGLVRERLVPLSDALANLADWLMGICVEAGTDGVFEDDEGGDGEYREEGTHDGDGGVGEGDGDEEGADEPQTQDISTVPEGDERLTSSQTLSDELASPEKESPEKVLAD